MASSFSLPEASCNSFTHLKRATLDRLGSTPEGHRQRFRGLSFEEAGRPFAYAQQLLNAARCWLQSGTNSAKDIVGQAVLEQFISGLPSSTSNWVQCHHPSTIEAVIVLSEDHLSLAHQSMREEARPVAIPCGLSHPGPKEEILEIQEIYEIE